ncbi:MAG TPA: hypothetical protein VL346_11495 [Acidobacteriaceae bacterium]|nr:hypothetical protein [Acidobacteriaceae bacterium]
MKTGLALGLAAALLAAGVSAEARTIHGVVTNGTNGKPSSGDKVTLLSLAAALDEVGHATTNGKGEFTLTTPEEQPYLIRVEHQKGAYFKNVPPMVSDAAITVYDVAAKVEGVSTEADVMRMEADNGQLKVTENYFVKNASSPPRTQVNDHGYEVVIPPDATLDGAATVGPSGMPTSATPDPVQPKGHYAFNFPIRPNEGENETRFQLTYHVPYSGSYKLSPKLMQDTANVAVILPKGMTFAGAGFQPVPDNVSGQTYLVRNVKPGQAIDFSVSGTGSFPRETQADTTGGAAAAGQMQGGQGAEATQSGPGGAPGGGIGNPIDTADPLAKYKWWIISGLGLALVVAAAFLLRKPSGAAVVEAQAAGSLPIAPANKGQMLLEALKEELFAIESEKVAGKLTPAEYLELKTALETVLKRALERGKAV